MYEIVKSKILFWAGNIPDKYSTDILRLWELLERQPKILMTAQQIHESGDLQFYFLNNCLCHIIFDMVETFKRV